MPTELGPQNARIERVRDLRTPRGRAEQGRFAIEGPTLIAEAQRSGLIIKELFATAALLAERRDLVALERTGTTIFSVTERALERLSDVETPTGILAVLDLPPSNPAAILDRPGLILVLAGVNDPGNAGTLVRSAEAFGATGVLFGKGGVDAYSPKVVRGAMGSIFRMPVAMVEAAWLLDAAAQAKRPIVAADIDGDELGSQPLPPNALLAIGNERRGVREWLPRWDRAVRIPQSGQAESLNAAVAGSILLYEFSRARSRS